MYDCKKIKKDAMNNKEPLYCVPQIKVILICRLLAADANPDGAYNRCQTADGVYGL